MTNLQLANVRLLLTKLIFIAFRIKSFNNLTPNYLLPKAPSDRSFIKLQEAWVGPSVALNLTNKFIKLRY